MPDKRTHWLAIALLFFAGCTTALHIGKVPSALPLLRESWNLSLTQIGLVVSIHAVLIATGGLLLGMLVRRRNMVEFAVVGVGLVGFGSALGAQAGALPLMLFSRSLEGLGWILSVITLPPLLSALSQANDRSLVMGIWGAFMPIGAGCMLLLAPSLQHIGGWQLSWWFASVLSLSASIVVLLVTRRYVKVLTMPALAVGNSDFGDLRKRVVWLLSGCFFAYSFQFISVTSFLPTLFLETTSMSLSLASRMVAVVIMSNALGNLAAGLLIRQGVSHVRVLISGAMGTGIFGLIVFTAVVPAEIRLACAFAFSISGGLIPGALFATIPRAASQASAAGLLIGLMMQLSGAGQLLGGVLIPGATEYFGSWQAAGCVVFIAGASGCCFAWLSRNAGGLKP